MTAACAAGKAQHAAVKRMTIVFQLTMAPY
jgi:hypothetical protein